jgi:ABC-type polysaccharide/polyol phosphate export permease
MAGVLQTIVERRELLFNLVMRELKSRYKGSVLGFLWTVLTPLFMALVYVFFLRLLVGRGVPAEEIIIGVFAWTFTMQCVNGGMMSVTGNGNLVKKVHFPRIILPISTVIANLAGYLLSLVVQFPLVALLLFLRGSHLSAWSPAFPAVLLIHLLFNLGLALLLSSLNVYFRDTQHLVGVLTSAWFFVSPVMYNLSFVEQMAGKTPWLVAAYLLNPMAVIVTGYRACLLPGVAFPWSPFAVASLLLTALFLWGTYVLFQRLQRYFADML